MNRPAGPFWNPSFHNWDFPLPASGSSLINVRRHQMKKEKEKDEEEEEGERERERERNNNKDDR